MSKGANLSLHAQDELNAIALSRNNRPRKRHDWRTPQGLYSALVELDQTPHGTVH